MCSLYNLDTPAKALFYWDLDIKRKIKNKCLETPNNTKYINFLRIIDNFLFIVFQTAAGINS